MNLATRHCWWIAKLRIPLWVRSLRVEPRMSLEVIDLLRTWRMIVALLTPMGSLVISPLRVLKIHRLAMILRCPLKLFEKQKLYNKLTLVKRNKTRNTLFRNFSSFRAPFSHFFYLIMWPLFYRINNNILEKLRKTDDQFLKNRFFSLYDFLTGENDSKNIH